MSDLERIENIIDNSFGIGGFSSTEKQGLLSSEQMLVIMFDQEGEIQFAIVEGVDKACEVASMTKKIFTKDNIEHDTKKSEVK